MFSLLEVESVTKCQNGSNLENVESICERRPGRRRLSIIRGGVKETFYCPREISIFFWIWVHTYDTIYQLCYFGILWQDFFLSLSQIKIKSFSLMSSRKVVAFGGREGLVDGKRSMEAIQGQVPKFCSLPEQWL